MEVLTVIIAILSLCVSMLVAGWTIYRDAIQRPRFRVSIEVASIHQAGRPKDGPHIFVEALNIGPLSNRIGVVFVRKSWFRRTIMRDTVRAFVYPDWAHPQNTDPSARIEVGDRARFVYPYNENTFLTGMKKYKQIGVSDGYGRMHWASAKQFARIKSRFLREFPDAQITDQEPPDEED